jgi:predicted DNA-binding mobile mystery protein A
MNKRMLEVAHLEQKLSELEASRNVSVPSAGWLRLVRQSLGMTLQQVADKLGVTKQSVREMESRELTGAITLKRLREAAEAMEMNLVYGFVPKDGSVENLIERKARELATEIVERASVTMRLEDQENAPERIQRAIEERADELRRRLPKMLWD